MSLHLALLKMWLTVAAWREDDRERGDVPGWVLVTVMTAGLVAALGLFAKQPLENAFTKAITLVTGDNGSAA